MLNHPHHGHDPQTHRPVVLAAKPQFARARFGRVRLPAEAIAWVSICCSGSSDLTESTSLRLASQTRGALQRVHESLHRDPCGGLLGSRSLSMTSRLSCGRNVSQVSAPSAFSHSSRRLWAVASLAESVEIFVSAGTAVAAVFDSRRSQSIAVLTLDSCEWWIRFAMPSSANKVSSPASVLGRYRFYRRA